MNISTHLLLNSVDIYYVAQRIYVYNLPENLYWGYLTHPRIAALAEEEDDDDGNKHEDSGTPFRNNRQRTSENQFKITSSTSFT